MSNHGIDPLIDQQQPYEKPAVTDLGSVAEITEQTFGGCNTDNGTCCIPAYS